MVDNSNLQRCCKSLQHYVKEKRRICSEVRTMSTQYFQTEILFNYSTYKLNEFLTFDYKQICFISSPSIINTARKFTITISCKSDIQKRSSAARLTDSMTFKTCLTSKAGLRFKLINNKT